MKINILSLLCIIHCISLEAQEFKTKNLSVFKNGMVFSHKTTSVDASSKRLKISDLPIGIPQTSTTNNSFHRSTSVAGAIPVLFGSVWFYAPNNQLLNTAVFSENTQENKAITDPIQLLGNNLNKTLIFKLKDDPNNYEGTLISINSGSLFLRMGSAWKQLLLSQIDQFDFKETPNLTFANNSIKKVIQLDFEKAASNQHLDLMYMQRGISWTPNYYLTIGDNNEAQLSLKANLINDIEDLEEVDINFVLGIPSFRFSNMQEPLFSQQSLVDFLTNINQPISRSPSMMTNMITSQRAMVNRNVSSTYPTADIENLGKEDLFFYKRSKISLPKGGRMLIHILDTKIKYEDVYSVQLSKGFSGIDRDDSFRNIVWHSLKFRNESGFPLTTGSIFFMNKEGNYTSPISQNQLDFVPAGQMASVKMTQVPDISVLDSEKEIKRQEEIIRYWDLVTVKASIEVTNYKDHQVKLEVEREITGTLIETNLPWEAQQITKKLNANNQDNYVKWSFDLKSGEKKKIIYSYSIMVK